MESCFEPENIADADRLAADDPRHRHLAECARCRSMLATYRAFARPEDRPRGANLEAAQEALAAFLAREVAPPWSREKTRTLEISATLRRDTWLRRRLAFLRGSGVRAGLAAAAVLVVAAGIYLVHDSRVADPRRMTLRGGAAHSVPLELAPPEMAAGGEVMLRWRLLTGMDAYRVEVYDESLSLLETLPAGRDTSLSFRPAELSPALSAGGTLFVRVTALRKGDEIAQSRTQAVVLP
jgi:hypothetical protein